MPIVRHGMPKILRVKVLHPCTVSAGRTAMEGDVWDLAAASAVSLMSAEQAERIVTDDNIVELHDPIENYSEGPGPPAPKLISRITESQRKPRPPALVPLNFYGPDLVMVPRR